MTRPSIPLWNLDPSNYDSNLTTMLAIRSSQSWPGSHYYGKAWMLPITTRTLFPWLKCDPFNHYYGRAWILLIMTRILTTMEEIYLNSDKGSRYYSWAQSISIVTRSLNTMWECCSLQSRLSWPYYHGEDITMVNLPITSRTLTTMLEMRSFRS